MSSPLSSPRSSPTINMLIYMVDISGYYRIQHHFVDTTKNNITWWILPNTIQLSGYCQIQYNLVDNTEYNTTYRISVYYKWRDNRWASLVHGEWKDKSVRSEAELSMYVHAYFVFNYLADFHWWTDVMFTLHKITGCIMNNNYHKEITIWCIVHFYDE